MPVVFIPFKLKFQLLYDAVKDMTRKSDTTPLFRDLESKLERWRPLIYERAEMNMTLDCVHHDPDLDRQLQIQLEKGHQLIKSYHSKVKGVWKQQKKDKYAKKLQEFSESLDACLVRQNLQPAWASSRTELMERMKIVQQVEAAVEAVHEVMRKPADVTSETESDVIQVQPFPRRIQNWLVNGSYNSWRIVFMVPFLLSIVMAATGSTAGTNWFVFNIGFNNLGINNN